MAVLTHRAATAAAEAARMERDVDGDGSGSGVAFPRGDERLQLIFTACHPALTLEARAALTLRTVLNVSVDDLATLFAVTPMQKRLVRARAHLRSIADAR